MKVPSRHLSQTVLLVPKESQVQMWEVSASFEPGSSDPRSARRWPVFREPRRGSGGPPYRRTRHSGRKVASPVAKRKPMTAEQKSRWSDVQEAKGREEMTFTSFPIRPTGILDGLPPEAGTRTRPTPGRKPLGS